MIRTLQIQHVKVAWTLAILGLALLFVALLLMWLNNDVRTGVPVYLFIFNAFLPVGWLIATRRPDNAIGWLFLSIAITTNLSFVMEEYARMALITAPGSLPGGQWVAWLVGLIQPLAWMLMFTSLFLFPTGRPLNRGWGVFVWASFVYAAASLLLATFTSPFLGDTYFPGVHSPLYFDALAGLATISLGIWAFSIIIALAIVGVLRFRGANPIEKQQLKWFTYSLLLIVVISAIQQIAGAVSSIPQTLLDSLSFISILPPIIAVAIAILRYRLYDIDLIIRRTLVYAVLTGMLALVYWGGVAALQSLLSPITGGGNELAIVGTTLLIAALFLPLRRLIQRFIDRRFFRRKYDAAKMLEAFSTTMRDEVDLDNLTSHLLEVVEQTMQPVHTSLWLRGADSEVE